MARKRLGELLMEAGLLDETGLRAALVEQRRTGGPLGRVLVDMKLMTEDDLGAALSKQLAVPQVDLDAIDIPTAVLELVPAEVAEAQGIIPFAQPMKFLDVATSDPTNLTLIDELRVKTNLNVRTHFAGPRAIERALARFYGRGVNVRGVPGRRSRDSVALDPPLGKDRMEMVDAYDPDAMRAAARPARSSTGGLSALIGSAAAAPVAPPRPVAEPSARGPSFADLAALQERVLSLEALVRRDEDVLKKLMALLIEKGVATRDEIIAKLK